MGRKGRQEFSEEVEEDRRPRGARKSDHPGKYKPGNTYKMCDNPSQLGRPFASFAP